MYFFSVLTNQKEYHLIAYNFYVCNDNGFLHFMDDEDCEIAIFKDWLNVIQIKKIEGLNETEST